MPPVHFSVTQVRIAAACPRILYFDARHTREKKLKQPVVSMIWKQGGSESTACGSLFHNCIESFNRGAIADAAFHAIVSGSRDRDEMGSAVLRHVYDHYLNRDSLFEKSGPQQQAFLVALRTYVDELADILSHARGSGKAVPEIAEELFGDRRRRVDVTFTVGPQKDEVHVTGILDYFFFDWRSDRHRIIDYKLTPASTSSSDLFQVCVYALMHHLQHGTRPDVGVLYLHPRREMRTLTWEQVEQQQDNIKSLLASMAGWAAYDPDANLGVKPPGEPIHCDSCRWSERCERDLGPRTEGDRVVHRMDLAENASTPTPSVGDAASRTVATKRADTTPSKPTERSDPSPDSLWLGQSSAERVEAPATTLTTHVAVVGAAGSGKTWMSKVIAEEAARQGIAVLAVDPQGDLVQMIRPTSNPTLHDAAEQWRRGVYPRILTPGTSHGQRIQLSPVRLPSQADLASIDNEQRRREELDSFISTVAGNIVHLARAGGDADCQRAFLFQILRALARSTSDGDIDLQRIVDAVADPESVGLDDPDRVIRKTEREKITRKIHAILHGPAANLFSGGEPLRIDRLVDPVHGKTPVNIVYLNALANDDQKQFFVSALATEIYRWMIATGSASARPKLLFYLDEARDFLPAGARVPPAKDPLIRLFNQGRKFGVACLICTQSPRSVDYRVFSNCSMKLIGRLEAAQDVDRVADWFRTESSAPQWLAGRKGAESGSFVARWPGMPEAIEGQPWKSRPLWTMHEGAWSPERVELESRSNAADLS